MPPNESSPSRMPLVDLATVFALIAAWLYVAGWTYALHYFARFEVGLLALDIPHEYYLMYQPWPRPPLHQLGLKPTGFSS